MTLRIDAGEFLFALESHDAETEYYLDLQTGEIIHAAWGAFAHNEPQYAEFESVRDDEVRYRLIGSVPSREGWRWMRDFAESVSDARVQERLLDAIHGSGAFGRFKRVLSFHPEVREAWFRFHEERLLVYAREWLHGESIEAELTELPTRRPNLHLVE
jgi:hypothetical protein